MNDKELLELAAKAAGHRWHQESEEHGWWIMADGKTLAWWNPLTDDGDALRLAVKLNLVIEFHLSHPYVAVFAPKIFDRFEEELNDDPYAATRRAIVRAAAEIGRTM